VKINKNHRRQIKGKENQAPKGKDVDAIHPKDAGHGNLTEK
jgi:hypothetical protein